VSSPLAGWYADPENAAHLRYWDGSAWTEHRAPAQQAGAAPAPVAYAQPVVDLYGDWVDLAQVLTPEQREQYRRHGLNPFPTWLAVVLHFLTLGIFTFIAHGLKFSKLPVVKQNDFGTGKAIGFMFIPFFNIYWLFRFALGLTDRLNFQHKLRGLPPPVSRGLVLAACIVNLIPYIGLISFAILVPIVSGQWQSAANRLAAERVAPVWTGAEAPQALPPSPPLA
jgi:hypothetical protein